jgi:4-amino-4-deoxychorismate lyase
MILVNGLESSCVSVLDRGLMYGDGVFRTLLLRKGMAIGWQRHHIKLAEDCAALGIACPTEQELEEDLVQAGKNNPDCVAKIIVTRGEGARGYALSPTAKPTRIVVTSPLPDYPAHYADIGVKVHLCDLRLCHQPRLAGIKHLNRLENVLARSEWDAPDIAEGLLLDVNGSVVEGTMSNLFMLKGQELHTPDLSLCGVAGVQRQRIMTLAPDLGLQLKVSRFDLPQLIEANEVLLCNSIFGVWQIRELAGQTWQRGMMTEKIRQLLEQEYD